MDKKTLSAYAQNALSYSEDWLSQPEPSDMYELLKKFFVAGAQTADIGCGNGRDAHWLGKNGFRVFGFDSSSELLTQASELFPEISFKKAFLPAGQNLHWNFYCSLNQRVSITFYLLLALGLNHLTLPINPRLARKAWVKVPAGGGAVELVFWESLKESMRKSVRLKFRRKDHLMFKSM